MKNFIMIGGSGYIAPRHMEAIKKTGNNLLAVHDINDSIGILDKYFPKALFFKDINKFKKYIKNIQLKKKIDYLTICSPNYLHLKHIELGLRNSINVICEKPIVLEPKDLIKIKKLELKFKKKVNCILQLRLNKKLVQLKEKIKKTKNKNFNVKIKYVSYRGDWFFKSWKGNASLSGGIATNIGIHFFDLLFWLFGARFNNKIVKKSNDHVSGNLIINDTIKINWFLSVRRKDLPKKNISTYRSIKINDNEIEFSNNFNNLHILSYKKIIKNEGFGIDTVFQSIDLCYQIRNFINK